MEVTVVIVPPAWLVDALERERREQENKRPTVEVPVEVPDDEERKRPC